MNRPSQEAKKYLGQREISGNHGFVDPKFHTEMVEEGFKDGYAWCMLLARVVYVNCYPEKSAELRKLFVPGVLNTFRNLKDAAYPIGNIPQIDSLVCWRQMRQGKPSGLGHSGICSAILTDSAYSFKSIEGNTSTGVPGEREGVIVAEHSHRLDWKAPNGLELLGFIQISKPINLTLNV